MIVEMLSLAKLSGPKRNLKNGFILAAGCLILAACRCRLFSFCCRLHPKRKHFELQW